MAATADFFLIPALDRDRSVAKGLPFGSNVVVENPLPAVLACSATAPGAPKKKLRARMCAKPVVPGEFVAAKHFYPKVLPSTIHPQVASFLALSNEQIAAIFCARNPEVDLDELVSILNTGPKYFRWAGSDLFNAKNIDGKQQMIIVETNSCPSGQKSMPPVDAGNKSCGYLNVIKTAFKEVEESAEKSLGGLAVVCDKNMMEASGYAAAMADFFNEKVHLAEYFVDDLDPPVKWESNLMYIRDAEDVWHPIRACFRYVTQKPWNRFPLSSRTAILNSTIACLSGGRNKLMAAQAYDSFNDEVAPCGVGLRIPETIQNVSKSEIPAWLERMGGHAVIKVPYSNAGQGVYTITNKKELDEFMDENHHYEKFIVQALVGAPSWKATHRPNSYFHAGNFVADLRMMVTGCASGFRPAAMYARRARQPIPERLEDQPDVASWDILGTNLSVKLDNGDWTTETERLVIMDTAEFESLQLSTYNLCDAYIQTVFSVLAIDRMCQALMVPNGHGGRSFDLLKFGSRNPDDVLVNEIVL